MSLTFDDHINRIFQTTSQTKNIRENKIQKLIVMATLHLTLFSFRGLT